MKTSIWDILTGVTLLGILCLILGFVAIVTNPQSAFNPFKPYRPTLVPMIALPTATEPRNQLPPTWTPSPRVVNTVVMPAAEQAGTDEPSTQLLPSSTPLSTNTPLVLPSFTPTRSVSSGVAGGNCAVIYQNPADNTVFKPGETIGEPEVRWTIKNTSTKEWRADSVDIRYMPSAGEKVFHTGANVLDLAYGVQPGSMIDITMRMTAPSTPAVYTSNWALMEGGKVLCRFYITINVR